MKIISETTPIRDLMPEGFTRKVMASMGEGSASIISEVVNTEKITSKYWAAIVALAMEVDSKATRARLKYLNDRILEKGKQNIKARRNLNAAA